MLQKRTASDRDVGVLGNCETLAAEIRLRHLEKLVLTRLTKSCQLSKDEGCRFQTQPQRRNLQQKLSSRSKDLNVGRTEA